MWFFSQNTNGKLKKWWKTQRNKALNFRFYIVDGKKKNKDKLLHKTKKVTKVHQMKMCTAFKIKT